MNLPLAVGAPITRTIQGTTHLFPRLNLREYGELLQSWIDRDLARLSSDLAEDGASEEEAATVLRRFKRVARTQGYIFDKLSDLRDGQAIVDMSLKKAGSPVSADELGMDLCDMAELRFELWSRRFLAGYRLHVRSAQEGTPDPKSQPSANSPTDPAATPTDPTDPTSRRTGP